jgi:hypothetical protein
VAIDTAVLVKFACAGLHLGGIVESGGWLIMRMAYDRSGANLDQRPFHDCRLLRRAGHAIEPATEKDRSDDGEDNCKCTDCC